MTAPPPVPALPDTERRTTYSITAQTGPFAVNFAIYGDSTDFANWIEVWINGVQQIGNWTITSPTGPIATIPRPITDAVLTFTVAKTGTLQIIGARRPRRTSQFAENQGVTARDLNQVLTDITAQLREKWDQVSRFFSLPPGVGTMATTLPVAGEFLKWNATANGVESAAVITPSGSFPVATQSEAIAGTSNTVLMTPLRTAQRDTDIGVFEVDTRVTAQATTFPIAINVVRTGGYTTAGDGGAARYVRGIVSDPGVFQDAGGVYWKLDLSVGPINAAWFGAKGDGATNDTTAIQAAITAAAGNPLVLNAGTFVVTAQLTYSTTTGTPFTPGLKLSGAGVGKTFIDNRVAGTSCLVSQSTVANKFQLGGYIRDLTVMTTTIPATSSGIEIKAVYQFRIENVHIIGLTSNGAVMSCVLGDADALNVVLWRNCRFENCGGAGLICNFGAGITQPSFVRVEDCFFSGNTLAGYYYIGLQGVMINCAFATNVGPGLWMAYNASSNAQFYAAANSFENNGGAASPQVRIDSLQGGEFIATEIATTVAGFPAQIGFSIAQAAGTVQGTRIEGTRVRVSATFNPYTLFRLFTAATLNVISNTFWQTFDAAGQVRYNVDAGAYGNRTSDGFSAVMTGFPNGTVSITAVNGLQQNFQLPIDGTTFGVLGPTAVFSFGGFAGGQDGRTLELVNTTGFAMTLVAEDAGSTAANRIRPEGLTNVTVQNQGCVTLRYFAALARWSVTGKG